MINWTHEFSRISPVPSPILCTFSIGVTRLSLREGHHEPALFHLPENRFLVFRHRFEPVETELKTFRVSFNITLDWIMPAISKLKKERLYGCTINICLKQLQADIERLSMRLKEKAQKLSANPIHYTYPCYVLLWCVTVTFLTFYMW